MKQETRKKNPLPDCNQFKLLNFRESHKHSLGNFMHNFLASLGWRVDITVELLLIPASMSPHKDDRKYFAMQAKQETQFQ